MLVENMCDIDTSIPTNINHEWRAVAQISVFQQLGCIVNLSPRGLPFCPSLHVASESLKTSGAFLKPPKEVETIWVTVGMIVHIYVGGLLIRDLGEVSRQIVTSRNVLVCSKQGFSLDTG